MKKYSGIVIDKNGNRHEYSCMARSKKFAKKFLAEIHTNLTYLDDDVVSVIIF